MEATNKHYLKHKNKIKQTSKTHYSKNPEKYKEYGIKDTIRKRDIIFEILGSVCICNGENCCHIGKCIINDKRCLQFDHLNGNGNQQRIKTGGGRGMYGYYIKHQDLILIELQVLCANCNWVKRHNLKEACGKSK